MRPNRKYTSHWLGSGKEAFCVSFLRCYPLRGELSVSGEGIMNFIIYLTLGCPPSCQDSMGKCRFRAFGGFPEPATTKIECHPGGDYQHPHPGARARGKYPKSPTFGALVPSFRTNMCTSMPPGGEWCFFSSWRAPIRAESQISTVTLGIHLFEGGKRRPYVVKFFFWGGVEVVCEIQIFWVWNGWKFHSWQFCDRDPFRMVKWSFWMAKFIAKTQPLTTPQKPQVPNWNLFLDLN